MVRFGSWEDLTCMKGVLRSALTMNGERCVMTTGMEMMLKWSALNLDYPPSQVQNSDYLLRYLLIL